MHSDLRWSRHSELFSSIKIASEASREGVLSNGYDHQLALPTVTSPVREVETLPRVWLPLDGHEPQCPPYDIGTKSSELPVSGVINPRDCRHPIAAAKRMPNTNHANARTEPGVPLRLQTVATRAQSHSPAPARLFMRQIANLQHVA